MLKSTKICSSLNAEGPQWPTLTRKNLKPNQIYGVQMITIDGCLALQEAQKFVEIAESIGFKHQGSRGAAFGEAFRDNDRISVESVELARQIYKDTGLREILDGIHLEGQRAVGLNSNIRIYRYNKGQRFGRHVDDTVYVEQPAGNTQYTLLIYLSACVGGETKFYDERGRKIAAVSPQPGLAFLHRHGECCLEHEGAMVKEGVKYILRSDVVFA